MHYSKYTRLVVSCISEGSVEASLYEVTFVCGRVLWEAVDYEPEEGALQEVNEPLLSHAISSYQLIYLTSSVCVGVIGSRNGA